MHLVTDERAFRYTGTFPAENVHSVQAATIGSRNPIAIARSLINILRGIRQSSSLIVRIRPRVVVGFGGYPTLPPLLAAFWRGVPTIIHEQNAVMGRANRMLARGVTVIAGGFLKAHGPHAKKIIEIGNPVRQSVLEAAGMPYSVPESSGTLRILVFGGSQGARFFSDTIPEVVARLPEGLRKRLAIVQQARPEDEERVRRRYQELEVEAQISSFFPDLPARMAESHLVISRSGASTVLELSVIGRPSILVPLPHSIDDDQTHNAKLLVNAGGAVLKPQDSIDPDRFARELGTLLQERDRLVAMAAGAKGLARTNATEAMADLTEKVASRHANADRKRGTAP